MTVPTLSFVDRCIFNAVSSGTGSFVVASLVPGFQTPAQAGIIDANQYGYAAQLSDLSQWEYGYGTYTASTQTLTRTVLGNNLNTTATVNFTSPPQVLLTLLGESLPFSAPIAGGNLDFYVATTGSNSNPGTIARPFATIQHAIDTIGLFRYQNLFFPTIHVADGTYTETLTAVFIPDVRGDIVILGNSATPANVIVQNPAPGGNNGFLCNGSSTWELDGFYFKNFQRLINVENFATMFIDNCILEHGPNACASVFLGNNRATIQVTGLGRAANSITIQGTGAGVLVGLFIGCVLTQVGNAMIFSGTNHFTNFVFFVTDFSECTCGFVSNAGVIGRRYDISTFSLLNVTAASRAALPGNAPGFLDTAGLIVQDPIYQIATPASGNTVTATPGCHQLILNPAAGLATLTVNLPIEASDGETISISTTQTITALTVATTDGSTVVGSPTTLAASQHFCMMFDANNTTWYPSGSVFT